MNNTLGIEHAYSRIHKLEVEALNYKDKNAELEKELELKKAECQLLAKAVTQDTEVIIQLKAVVSKLNTSIYMLNGTPVPVKDIIVKCHSNWDELSNKLEKLNSKGGAE